MNRVLLVVLLVVSSVLAQTPIREVTGVSGVTSRTIVQSIYRPTPSVVVQAFASKVLLPYGGYADIFFGAYSCNLGPEAGVGLARDQWGIVALGPFVPNATDIFVDPQVFLLFPPGDYTTIHGGFRRGNACTTVPVDTIYSAGLLIGYLPGGFDMVAQAVFLTSSAPILSEAVRVRVQNN